MLNSLSYRCTSRQFLIVASVFLSLSASAQTRKEYRYTVRPKPVITITNSYGGITVQPSGTNQVVVTTISYSDDISFLNEQAGNRIELRAESKHGGTGLGDYLVLVPADSNISLRSCAGKLHAERMRGDVMFEATMATVEATKMRSAHIYVKTLSGPVVLSDIRDSRLSVQSVSGNINMDRVAESAVEAHSGSGAIKYEGDPGVDGDYVISSHSGDLEVTIPASAPVDIRTHSVNGTSDQGDSAFRGAPTQGQKNLFVKPGMVRASRFVLRSFKGSIRLKRP